MLVSELMSTDVATVARDAELRVAVGRMLAEGVGSLVVVDEDDQPIGLLTERDVLAALSRGDRDLSDLTVDAIAHSPAVTTSPDSTVPFVADTMTSNGVKKVPVMDDLDLVGIVTLTDVVEHLSDIRREASAHSDGRTEWNRGP